MNKDQLLGTIKSKGLTVTAVLKKVNDDGINLAPSTFYKGLRDERPFKTNEIKALVKVIPLTRSETMDIFLQSKCPKRHAKEAS